MDRAVGYIRVSTSSQIEKDSLKNQADKILRYCELRDYELIHVYEDAGISGAHDDRPGIQSLLAAAKRKEFKHVIVNDLSRFGRNARDLLVNTSFLEEQKVTFHVIKESIDCSTSYGKFLMQILSACAELEREQISVRMSEVKYARWRTHKIYNGKLAFGYRWNKSSCEIEIIPEEAEVYKRIVMNYLDLGKSLVDISIELQRDHIPTRNGKGRWYSATLHSMLRSTIYHGILTVNQVRKDAKCKVIGMKPEHEHIIYETPPLISKSRWDLIQERLSSGRHERAGRPLTGADRFILRDLMKCGHCGGKVIPRAVKDDKQVERLYYVCYWRDRSKKHCQEADRDPCILPYLPASLIDKYVFSYVISKLAENPEENYDPVVAAKNLEEREHELNTRVSQWKSALVGKRKAIGNLDRMLEMDDFDPVGYNAKRSMFLVEIREIEQHINDAQQEIYRLRELAQEQEKYQDFVRSDRIREIHFRLVELSKEEQHRLVRGLLNGPIVVAQPGPDAKIDKNAHFSFGKWLKFQATPNYLILQDVLGLSVGDTDYLQLNKF